MFPYEWLDSYKKLSHVGPVSYEDFYSSLKSCNTTRDEYKRFLKSFKKNDCTTMGDWHLGRWSSITILIKLMYAKARSVSQVYQ